VTHEPTHDNSRFSRSAVTGWEGAA
jgi:hypothetical protein